MKTFIAIIALMVVVIVANLVGDLGIAKQLGLNASEIILYYAAFTATKNALRED